MDRYKIRLIYGNNVHQISRDCYIAKTNDKQCIIFKDRVYNIEYTDSVDILFNKVAVVTNIGLSKDAQHIINNSRGGKYNYMLAYLMDKSGVRQVKFINLYTGDMVDSNYWMDRDGKIISVNNDKSTLSILDMNLKTINKIQLKRKVKGISVIRDSRRYLDIELVRGVDTIETMLAFKLNELGVGFRYCIRINKNTMKITEIKGDK